MEWIIKSLKEGGTALVVIPDGILSNLANKNLRQFIINNLNMEYLKYIIEPILRKNIKGRMGHDGENEYTSLKLNVFIKLNKRFQYQ